VSIDTTADAQGSGRSRFAAGLVLLAALGASLTALPHLIAWARTGDPAYIVDMDDLLYLAWSRATVLDGSWQMTDAVNPRSGPMMHPWLLFVPPGLLAHALGAGMIGVGVVWRVLAGAGVALGLYAAVRPAVNDRRVALALAVILTCDAGLLWGQPIKRPAAGLAASLAASARSSPGPVEPTTFGHLRVVTPAMAIPLLMLHYGLLMRARTRGGRWATAGAAITFGLTFYAYFFFWTALVVGASLAFLLDRGHRRLHATVLIAGGLIGAPAVVGNYLTKASTPPDWLLRTDKMAPIGHTAELLFPTLVMTGLALLGLYVLLRRRDLIYLWCSAFAALALTNHQIITGLQIENFHWLGTLGLTFSLLLVYVVGPWLSGRRVLLGLAVLAAVEVAGGFYLRAREGLDNPQTREWARVYRDYRREPFTVPSGAVVGGEGRYVFLASALSEVYPLACRLLDFSSTTTNDAIDERVVLNTYLLGYDRATARTLLGRPEGPPWDWMQTYAFRPGPITDRLLAHRVSLVDQVWDDPRGWLRRLGVTHVVLPARGTGQEPGSGSDARQLDGLARPEARGRTWDLYRVNDAPTPTAPDAPGSPAG
jgi:hypothetical protein